VRESARSGGILERIRHVKRVAAGLGALFIAGAAAAGPACASTKYEGAAQYTYTIQTSFTAHIDNDYAPGNPSFQQGVGTILTSGSGTCTSSSGDTLGSYTLSFKTITLSSAGPTACLYQEGIGMSVNSNDSNGYDIYESLDTTTTTTYYGICVAVDHGGLPSVNAPNTSGSLSGVGTFNAGDQLTACATGGILIGPAPAAVTNPGTGGDAALLTAPPAGAYVASGALPATALFTYSTKTGGTIFYGEDVQLNLSSDAPSGTAITHALIIYFVPA
jgi:hypothetical protein